MASRSDLDAVPKPVTPGPQMQALARFHRDVTWTGTIEEGGMGPGTPTMTATGWGKHEAIQDGRWIVGTYEQDQYLADGTFVLKWQLHWVAGWDPANNEYRATIADNYGHAGVMHGRIDGDSLTFETVGDPPVRLRLTWDISDPASMIWRNEMSAVGGPWSLVEEYHCRPMDSASQVPISTKPISVPSGGSRAYGVTPAATFGDGVAVAVMVWHDCVRAFESGGLPACIQHRRARSLRGVAVDPGAGPAAHRRRQWGRMHTWWQDAG